MKIANRQLTSIALLCAMSYLAMLLFRIPVVLFLKYEPKDIIITLGGFIFGPLTAALISVIVSFLEMITVSDTGFIGLIMNILATCSFACTASYIYKHKHTMQGALLGLISGTLVLTATMLVWNYIFLPIFLGFPRTEVLKFLVPAILPFNLVKGFLNTALILLLYKHTVTALRHNNLLPPSADSSQPQNKTEIIIVAGFILLTCILVILSFRGIL